MKLTAITTLLVLVLGVVIIRATKSNENTRQQNLEQHIADNQPSQEYTNASDATTTGRYIPFSALNLDEETNKIVYFFNASWCPTCQVAKKAFSEQANMIPDGLTIVDVDYDEHKDLRIKYGVTSQHTFVQIDTSGNQIKKWTGSFVPVQIIKEVV